MSPLLSIYMLISAHRRHVSTPGGLPELSREPGRSSLSQPPSCPAAACAKLCEITGNVSGQVKHAGFWLVLGPCTGCTLAEHQPRDVGARQIRAYPCTVDHLLMKTHMNSCYHGWTGLMRESIRDTTIVGGNNLG